MIETVLFNIININNNILKKLIHKNLSINVNFKQYQIIWLGNEVMYKFANSNNIR